MSIKPAEIRSAICGDDFGHEMRIGTILENFQPLRSSGQYHNVDCDPPRHGGTYIDPITNKPRQFDYRFLLWRTISTQSLQNVSLAVECKNLHPSSPLVISGRDRTKEEAFHTYIRQRDTGIGLPFHGKMAQPTFESRVYPKGEFVGKSLSRLKSNTSGKDKSTLYVDPSQQTDIYDRWSQAVASSRELAIDALTFAQTRNVLNCLSFIMPVVVVPDKSLWMAKYNCSGELAEEPREADELHYFIATPFSMDFKNLPVWFIQTNIHFVTITGFQKLLTGFTDPSDQIWDKMFPHIP